MKIKITEAQAKRFKLISENADPISQFELFCKSKIEPLNGIFSVILHTNMDEILNRTIKISVYTKKVAEIDRELQKLEAIATNFANQHPESNLDERVDKARDLVFNKLSGLETILSHLENIQLYREQYPNDFKDIKPMDISNL